MQAIAERRYFACTWSGYFETVSTASDLFQRCPGFAVRDAVPHAWRRRDQVAQEPLGLVCVVLVPGLTERLLDARTQMLGQALDDVTALVDLAALDGGGHTEGVSDRWKPTLLSAFAPSTMNIAAAASDRAPWRGDCRSRPGSTTVFSVAPSTDGQDMLVADADRSRSPRIKDTTVADMPDRDLDDTAGRVEIRASQPFIFLRDSATKAPGNGLGLRGAVATRFRQVALGQTDRAVVLAGRHVQHHQVERPLEQQVAIA